MQNNNIVRGWILSNEMLIAHTREEQIQLIQSTPSLFSVMFHYRIFFVRFQFIMPHMPHLILSPIRTIHLASEYCQNLKCDHNLVFSFESYDNHKFKCITFMQTATMNHTLFHRILRNNVIYTESMAGKSRLTKMYNINNTEWFTLWLTYYNFSQYNRTRVKWKINRHYRCYCVASCYTRTKCAMATCSKRDRFDLIWMSFHNRSK